MSEKVTASQVQIVPWSESDFDLLRLINAPEMMEHFPSIHNPASNAVCRKLNFTTMSDCEFEYPPGHFMQCKDWRLELANMK